LTTRFFQKIITSPSPAAQATPFPKVSTPSPHVFATKPKPKKKKKRKKKEEDIENLPQSLTRLQTPVYKINQALSFFVFHPSPDSVFIFLFSHTPLLQAFFFIHPPQFHILTQLKPIKKDKLLLVEEILKARKTLLQNWSFIHRRLRPAVHAPKAEVYIVSFSLFSIYQSL
jgi:hypothetical protein